MFFRKRILPAERRPRFEAGERVLAWCLTSADEAIVATNLGLWRAGQRVGWHEVSKARWDGQVLTVITSRVVEPREGYDVIEDLPPERWVLIDPNHVPHQVQLRVTGSVKHPTRFSLGWLAARRVPGENGLSWIVRYDDGVDRASPEVVAETEVIHWKTVGGSE